MTTDTKAMSLQEAKDEIAKKYAFVWSIYEANHEAGLANPKRMKKYLEEAAELYKDSCLAAQKAELEKSITQEKAKAFDEMTEIEKENLVLFVNRMMNMPTNMGTEWTCNRTLELLKASGFQINPYRQDK